MRYTLVRYEVKPEEAKHNEELIRAVYDELARTEPDGIRYATFQVDDGVTFVHLAIEDGNGGPALSDLQAFQVFLDGIDERCTVPPDVRRVRPIGAFRLV